MPTEGGTHIFGDLIDRLYAAVFSEAPWQDFVDRSCKLLPNGKSALFFHDKTSGSGALSLAGGLDGGMVAKFNDHFHSLNPWVDHAMIRPLGKVMQADEMLPRNDLKRTEFFHDYLRPQDIETGLGVTVHRHDGLHVFFSIVCADASEDQIDDARRNIALLAPHLERAFRIDGGAIARRDGLQPPFEGILQVDSRLRVVEIDARALSLMAETDAIRLGPLGRLICKDTELLSCLQHMLASDLPVAVQHRHIKRNRGGIPIHACLYRPGSAGSAFLQETNCFIRLEDPALALPVGIRSFCTLHGLTAAEAEIVAGLAMGLTLDQIATRRKTAHSTVRTQLKTIFAKSGCTKQSDITCQIAILANDRVPTQPSLPPLRMQN